VYHLTVKYAGPGGEIMRSSEFGTILTKPVLLTAVKSSIEHAKNQGFGALIEIRMPHPEEGEER